MLITTKSHIENNIKSVIITIIIIIIIIIILKIHYKDHITSTHYITVLFDFYEQK